MKTRTETLTITAAVVLAAALAGCNPGADAGPITSATATPSSTTSTPTTPPTGTSGTSSTSDPAATEAQDRQDAELVWRQFLGVLLKVGTLPPNQVESAITAVATDPALTRLREQEATFRAQHKAGYGQDISHITWPQPIGGKVTAVLTDCADGSQAGVLDTKTGKKLTVGTTKTLLRATLHRTPSGWRVANSELLEGTACTPGV